MLYLRNYIIVFFSILFFGNVCTGENEIILDNIKPSDLAKVNSYIHEYSSGKEHHGKVDIKTVDAVLVIESDYTNINSLASSTIINIKGLFEIQTKKLPVVEIKYRLSNDVDTLTFSWAGNEQKDSTTIFTVKHNEWDILRIRMDLDVNNKGLIGEVDKIQIKFNHHGSVTNSKIKIDYIKFREPEPEESYNMGWYTIKLPKQD